MDFLWHILALIGMTIPHALGMNLIFGKGKIFHFGSIGVSVFTVYPIFIVLRATGSYPLALLVGFVAAMVISAFFAWLSLRLEPDGFGVISIAVHLSLLAVVLNWQSLTRGALGIPHIPRMPYLDSVADFAIFSLIITVAWVICIWYIDRSSFGRQLSALAEHEWHARSLGINRARVHLSAFLIGGVGAFLVSMQLPQYLSLLHPNDYQFPVLIFYIMIVVAGRPGSVWGVTLAAILLTILKEALRFVPLAPGILGPGRLILFGFILFAVVYWRRDVLFPHERKV